MPLASPLKVPSGELVDWSGETFNLFVDVVRRLNELGTDLEALSRRQRPPEAMVVFAARITGYRIKPAFDHQWEYSWEEVVYSASGNTWVVKPSGRTSTVSNPDSEETDEFARYAVNTAENGNQLTGVVGYGVNMSGADYPPGFALQAIQSEGYPVVPLFVSRKDDGKLIWWFAAGNDHDGTCAATGAAAGELDGDDMLARAWMEL